MGTSVSPDKQCFTWREADYRWMNTDYTWNDVCLALTVAIGGRHSKKYLDSYKKLPAKQKEEFISLILKVKGEKIVQKKLRKKYKVTARDVKMVLESVLRIEITSIKS